MCIEQILMYQISAWFNLSQSLSPVGLLRKQDFYGKKFTKILNHLHVIQTFEATIHHNIITLVNPIYVIYCCFMQKKTTTIN